MHSNENINSATGIIYRNLKRLNKEQDLGSNCPNALKLILHENFEKEYLSKQQHIVSEESRTKKRLNYDRIKEINDQENQKKEVIFAKFMDAVEQQKKYADPKFYRAPVVVKTKGLAQCIEESSDWYKEKTQEVIKRDKYMRAINKFSLNQKQASPSELTDQIYKIEEQVQEELQDTTLQNIEDISECNNNNNSSNQINQKEEQKYYLMNNFPLQTTHQLRPSTASRSSYLHVSKVKKQSITTNDSSTTQPTQTSFHQQLYKKIYQNDFIQIQDEIGRLQKIENEKEAHNIQQSQKILANKIASRNMDSLFNMKRKSKNINQSESSQSRLKLNKSEQNISIQGRNILSLSQNLIKQPEFLHVDEQQPNFGTSQTIKLSFEVEGNEGATPERFSPFLQPKMRQSMTQTSRGFSLDRPQQTKVLQRPQSAQLESKPSKQKFERPQSAQTQTLLAQMGSFPNRSNKKIQIKKGLIKRAQSANPKIQLKNINQENLFTFVPIKYANLRQDTTTFNQNVKETSYGNFFFSSSKYSQNQQERQFI